jgi:hypothetical protein
MDTPRHTRDILGRRGSGHWGGLGKTKAEVVVPVVRVVPVAVGRAQSVRFVVPRATTDHPPANV